MKKNWTIWFDSNDVAKLLFSLLLFAYFLAAFCQNFSSILNYWCKENDWKAAIQDTCILYETTNFFSYTIPPSIWCKNEIVLVNNHNKVRSSSSDVSYVSSYAWETTVLALQYFHDFTK